MPKCHTATHSARRPSAVRRSAGGCLAISVAATLAAVVCGCRGDRGPERVVVTGTVTYQGKPVAEGRIRFVPSKGTTGPVAVAKIVDGSYRADAKGGVPVATQRVEIFAFDRHSTNRDGNPELPTAIGASGGIQFLPDKYNDRSELELVVEAGHGEIHKDFVLSKPLKRSP